MNIKEKIKLYQDRIKNLQMQPLKIIVETKNPIYLSEHPIVLDGILNRALAIDLRGADALNVDIKDHLDLPLPLKRSGMNNKYYHASIMFFDKKQSSLSNGFWVKGWHDGSLEYINKKDRLKQINTGRGHYKNYIVNYSKLSTPFVYFYAYGIKSEIERLLYIVSNIGKKSSQAFGRFDNVEIEKTEQDLSCFNPDKGIMRPIPLNEISPDKIKDSFKKVMSYKPCYYDIKNYSLCGVPDPELWGIR
jgi:hypothetical protein